MKHAEPILARIQSHIDLSRELLEEVKRLDDALAEIRRRPSVFAHPISELHRMASRLRVARITEKYVSVNEAIPTPGSDSLQVAAGGLLSEVSK